MKDRNPWAWVPTLYFAEGLPYIAVTVLAIEIYMQLGLSDAEITFYTSWLYLPWVIKPFWSPFLDLYKTKRWWITTMQLLLGSAFAGVAFTIQADWWLQGSICFFWMLAFSSATHDVAADGFYMMGLDQHEQAFFVGIRSTFYRLSMIFGKGLLIMLAGVLQVMFRYQIKFSWSLIFYGLTGLFIAFYLYHNYILPRPKEDIVHEEKQDEKVVVHEFLMTFATFFEKKQILTAIAFMLLFRLPEALLTPISQLFLQAQPSKGGLGLSPQEFGLVNGTVGVIGLLAGGIIGGMLVSRDGLKKWIWPMTFAITIPNVAYVYLAYAMPESLMAINICVFLENFGYGFGFSAYMLFMIYFSQGEHKTSHYALCTGFMALSMLIPGLFAGALAQYVGYRIFFIIVMLSCMLPFFVASFLKIDSEFGRKDI
ncbi:MAG: MFS transporter [Prevotella sp.]|jgi:PAT family beta-lactamase induction signal transducer AmpG|nr:MFS transporter [Prevotella sp.]MBP7097907.1 MFS transporter [Prevotella sp.]MBP8687360.1 MFS transporter [Prevotella sp.]MBP9982879.1 MFS transporter [Prevotella sp.]MCI1731126.1 MFS transporter [Prevotella sp.]